MFTFMKDWASEINMNQWSGERERRYWEIDLNYHLLKKIPFLISIRPQAKVATVDQIWNMFADISITDVI